MSHPFNIDGQYKWFKVRSDGQIETVHGLIFYPLSPLPEEWMHGTDTPTKAVAFEFPPSETDPLAARYDKRVINRDGELFRADHVLYTRKELEQMVSGKTSPEFGDIWELLTINQCGIGPHELKTKLKCLDGQHINYGNYIFKLVWEKK